MALAALLLIVLPTAALAQAGPSTDDIDEAKDRVAELDADIADAELALAATRAELDALDADLRAANEALAAADAAAAEARRTADLARQEAEQTRLELEAAQEDLADNQDRLAEFARDTYKYGLQAATPIMAAFERLTSTDDPSDLADTLHMLEVVLDDRALVVQESVELIERTAELTRQARATERRRREEAAVADAALDEAAARHADVMALVDRTDAAVRRQQQLVDELERDRAAALDDVESLEAAARRAAEVAAAAVRATPVADGLVSVGGITVAASLAPQLEALLEAARANGIVLGGSGYRSPETTARLRRVNGCPDVYTSPASACRVPTARPGQSMHEQGLAVDFTYQGRTICYPRRASSCRGNAAFDWLAVNAGRYGLRVLDSEAWHWSTNGQ